MENGKQTPLPAFMRLPSVREFSAGSQLSAVRRRSTRVKEYMQHQTRPLSAGGLRQSMITLTQTAFGGGILTLAYGLKESGLWLGMVFVLLAAVVSYIGMDVMMRGAFQLQTFSTGGLMAQCLGKRSGVLLDLLIFLQGLGMVIIYLQLLGGLVPDILQPLLPHGHDLLVSGQLREWCILVTSVLAFPLALPRKLSALRYVSVVALVGIFFTIGTVVVKCYHSGGQKNIGAVPAVRPRFKAVETFTLLLFAYNCHMNVVPVAAEMMNPTDRRIIKVNLRVIAVELISYVLISVCGYLTFADRTHPNLLQNYSNVGVEGLVADICRVLLSCTLLFGIPVQLNPCLRSLMHIAEHVVGRNSALNEPLLAVEGSPLPSPTTESLMPIPSPPSPSIEQAANGERYNEGFRAQPNNGPHEVAEGCDWTRVLVVASALCLTTYVAIAMPNVATAVKFLGAMNGIGLMLALPLLVLRTVGPKIFTRLGLSIRAGLLGIALVLTFAATCSMVRSCIGGSC
mmetsp:Transcript_44491/g.81250  ORF Transcript_44491/g.81250 Transcript_44491/m.81250 type:complete len:512 (+) Transcript_44491:45-1580(+)